jgi:hypothetical protein
MANEVVWYHSDETGAPTMNNVAGSTINVLDACLISGFNGKTMTSLVVVGGVATATVSAHGYETGKIVLVAGSTPSALNGRKKITMTGANTFTFPAVGVSDSTASGTITVKRAPLGWTKLYTATNKAIYQRTDPTATEMLLRIDDARTAAPEYSRALMVESASDVDTYSGASPLSISTPDIGQYWGAGPNSTTPKKWVLVGDGKTFYFFTEHTSYSYVSYNALHTSVFGDIFSFRAGDAYNCVISGSHTPNGQDDFIQANLSAALVIARQWNQLGAAEACRHLPTSLSNPIGGSSNPVYPSPVDNGMVFLDTAFVQDNSGTFNYPIRGVFRGLKIPLGRVPTTLHRTILPAVEGSDREILLISAVAQGAVGGFGFDITGPWE